MLGPKGRNGVVRAGGYPHRSPASLPLQVCAGEAESRPEAGGRDGPLEGRAENDGAGTRRGGRRGGEGLISSASWEP